MKPSKVLSIFIAVIISLPNISNAEATAELANHPLNIEKNIENKNTLGKPEVNEEDSINLKTASDDTLKFRLKWGFWSLLFTTFGLLIGIGILFNIWKKSIPGVTYKDFFAEGQFVQLVVIIVIAGNVCSLGIMGILEKGEISTIYAGIVGYILGKRSDNVGKTAITGDNAETETASKEDKHRSK